MKLKKSLLFLTAALTAFSAQGGVSLKNGNFFISYTDIIVPGSGKDLEITRPFNSKSTYDGWFGKGWGSNFENRLLFGADGSVTVVENGSGRRTRFTPKGAVNASAAADKIIQKMKKLSNGDNFSQRTASDLKKQLLNDAELRQAYAKKFQVEASIAVGTELTSNARGIQRIVKTKNGYTRYPGEGKQEFYSDDGRLLKIKEKDGYSVSLKWEGKVVKSIKDSMAKQIHFSWYSTGKVKCLWSAGDKKSCYKYDEALNLKESVDVSGNKYLYSYDQHNNMTEIKYADGKTRKIFYSPATQFVTKVIKRDGEEISYDYGSNKKNPSLHYWTTVSKKTPAGNTLKNKYEYELKRRKDGSHYTYRIETAINGVKTETIYSECCSLPLQIKRGNSITKFDYNEDGLLTKKVSPREFIEIEYNKKFKKISKVTEGGNWTKFSYDKVGNLSVAENSKGKKVRLIYDRKGRIKKMLDTDKKKKKSVRKLSFKYNTAGKPVEITMDKVGKINVEYDNYGEIKKVESKDGHRMALQVTQAFQSLLSIVKPAGVNLNF